MGYTLEFKEQVIKEFKSGKTITELSDKYGIAPSTVFFWNKYFENDNRYTKYPHGDTLTCTELTTKVRALTKETKELKELISKLEKRIAELESIKSRISSLIQK